MLYEQYTCHLTCRARAQSAHPPQTGYCKLGDWVRDNVLFVMKKWLVLFFFRLSRRVHVRFVSLLRFEYQIRECVTLVCASEWCNGESFSDSAYNFMLHQRQYVLIGLQNRIQCHKKCNLIKTEIFKLQAMHFFF